MKLSERIKLAYDKSNEVYWITLPELQEIQSLEMEVKDFKKRVIPAWKREEKGWDEAEKEYKQELQRLREAFCKLWEKLVGKPIFLTDGENLKYSDLYQELNQQEDEDKQS